jgi:hypothetical protein
VPDWETGVVAESLKNRRLAPGRDRNTGARKEKEVISMKLTKVHFDYEHDKLFIEISSQGANAIVWEEGTDRIIQKDYQDGTISITARYSKYDEMPCILYVNDGEKYKITLSKQEVSYTAL